MLAHHTSRGVSNSNVWSCALFQRVYEVEDFESDNSNEEKTTVRRTREDVSVFNSHSRAPEETEQDQQTEVLEEVGTIHKLNFEEDGKCHEQSKENIEMKDIEMKVRVKPWTI